MFLLNKNSNSKEHSEASSLLFNAEITMKEKEEEQQLLSSSSRHKKKKTKSKSKSKSKSSHGVPGNNVKTAISSSKAELKSSSTHSKAKRKKKKAATDDVPVDTTDIDINQTTLPQRQEASKDNEEEPSSTGAEPSLLMAKVSSSSMHSKSKKKKKKTKSDDEDPGDDSKATKKKMKKMKKLDIVADGDEKLEKEEEEEAKPEEHDSNKGDFSGSHKEKKSKKERTRSTSRHSKTKGRSKSTDSKSKKKKLHKSDREKDSHDDDVAAETTRVASTQEVDAALQEEDKHSVSHIETSPHKKTEDECHEENHNENKQCVPSESAHVRRGKKKDILHALDDSSTASSSSSAGYDSFGEDNDDNGPLQHVVVSIDSSIGVGVDADATEGQLADETSSQPASETTLASQSNVGRPELVACGPKGMILSGQKSRNLGRILKEEANEDDIFAALECEEQTLQSEKKRQEKDEMDRSMSRRVKLEERKKKWEEEDNDEDDDDEKISSPPHQMKRSNSLGGRPKKNKSAAGASVSTTKKWQPGQAIKPMTATELREMLKLRGPPSKSDAWKESRWFRDEDEQDYRKPEILSAFCTLSERSNKVVTKANGTSYRLRFDELDAMKKESTSRRSEVKSALSAYLNSGNCKDLNYTIH